MATEFDREFDVIVVGSGGGGLTAALTADHEGLSTLVIEKDKSFGGTTARSGGGLWVPNAPALLRAGQRDDPEVILAYLDRLIGDAVPRSRIERYVAEAPRMLEFLESQGEYLSDGFFWVEGYSDYHPELGGHPLGRGVWARPIDRRVMGDDIRLLGRGIKRMQLPLGSWITAVDLRELLAVRWGGLKHKKILLKLAYRIVRARLLGERITVSGQALMIRLRMTLRDKGIPVWLETPMQTLITDSNDRVVGVETLRDGRRYRIGARHGVVLATGGFDHDLKRRRKYHAPLEREWSLGVATNTGDGISAGEALGAATGLMDDAWWMPTMEMPGGELFALVAERQYPGQFIVNGAGRRFVNESTPYVDFGHAQIAGERSGVSHVPAWMIVDHRAFKRNIIAGHFPGTPLPKSWVESGLARVAPTLDALAEEIGVPAAALRETADRFNGFARQGRDEDFHRGDSVYDQYYGDPSYKNPNLAEVSAPPFYAFQITPGDIGTKGGLLTDDDARVLREDESIIEGLYAVGNTSASVMGRQYAGPGATIGPSMAFGYVAARHIGAARRQAAEQVNSGA